MRIKTTFALAAGLALTAPACDDKQAFDYDSVACAYTLGQIETMEPVDFHAPEAVDPAVEKYKSLSLQKELRAFIDQGGSVSPTMVTPLLPEDKQIVLATAVAYGDLASVQALLDGGAKATVDDLIFAAGKTTDGIRFSRVLTAIVQESYQSTLIADDYSIVDTAPTGIESVKVFDLLLQSGADLDAAVAKVANVSEWHAEDMAATFDVLHTAQQERTAKQRAAIKPAAYIW